MAYPVLPPELEVHADAEGKDEWPAPEWTEQAEDDRADNGRREKKEEWFQGFSPVWTLVSYQKGGVLSILPSSPILGTDSKGPTGGPH